MGKSRRKDAKTPPPPPKPLVIIKNRHLERYSREERRYWDGLDDDDKLAVCRREDSAAGGASDGVPLRFRVLYAGFAPAVRRRMLRYVENLCSDDAKRREYLEVALSVPLGKYVSPFQGAEPRGTLERLRAQLDAAVYGHATTKTAIMRVVAQWLQAPAARGLAILLSGSPGTAKTAIVQKGVAPALGMPYTFVGLGGNSDASTLLGFSYCYQGSHVGAIAQSLIRHESMSQVMLFDELDKACDSAHGAALVNALIHVTDETSNTQFHDRYLGGDVDLDLSRSIFVFTCNDPSLISPILLDRMIRIDVAGYAVADKVEIAKRFLVPAALADFKLADVPVAGEVMASDAFVRAAIAATADEKGVRDLKRAVTAVCAELNLRRTLDPGYAPTRADIDDVLRAETRRAAPDFGMLYT